MRRFLGWSLIVVGAIVMLFAAIAFIDPVGTQMADDGDPFGTPAPRSESALIMALGLGTCVIGGIVKLWP